MSSVLNKAFFRIEHITFSRNYMVNLEKCEIVFKLLASNRILKDKFSTETYTITFSLYYWLHVHNLWASLAMRQCDRFTNTGARLPFGNFINRVLSFTDLLSSLLTLTTH